MSAPTAADIASAEEGLKDLKKNLPNLVSKWGGYSEGMQATLIGSACIFIHLCHASTGVERGFVVTLFREYGGCEPDHPLAAGVLKRLQEWGRLRT
jgi:hypothetical protein